MVVYPTGGLLSCIHCILFFFFFSCSFLVPELFFNFLNYALIGNLPCRVFVFTGFFLFLKTLLFRIILY